MVKIKHCCLSPRCERKQVQISNCLISGIHEKRYGHTLLGHVNTLLSKIWMQVAALSSETRRVRASKVHGDVVHLKMPGKQALQRS